MKDYSIKERTIWKISGGHLHMKHACFLRKRAPPPNFFHPGGLLPTRMYLPDVITRAAPRTPSVAPPCLGSPLPKAPAPATAQSAPFFPASAPRRCCTLASLRSPYRPAPPQPPHLHSSSPRPLPDAVEEVLLCLPPVSSLGTDLLQSHAIFVPSARAAADGRRP